MTEELKEVGVDVGRATDVRERDRRCIEFITAPDGSPGIVIRSQP